MRAPSRPPFAIALASLRAVLGNGGIRRLEASWALGVAGDTAALVGLLVAAYAAGGPALVGLLSVVRMVPAMLAGLYAGIPVARHRPERVLAAVALCRAASAALAGVALLAGAPIWIAFLAAAGIATAGALVRPTQSALFPSLARTPSELVAANVVASAAEGLGTFGGPLLAGIAVAVAGPWLALAIGAALFVASVVAVLIVPDIHHRVTFPAGRGIAAFSDGLIALRHRPGPAIVLTDFAAQVFVRGLLIALIVVASVALLGTGDAGVGWLNAAFGLGGLLGGLIALGIAGRSDLPRVFAVSFSLWGLPIAVIALVPVPAVAVAALAVTGAANAVLDVSGFTLLQRGVSQHERPAVFGLLEGIVGLGVSAGSIGASFLVDALGPRGALAVAGAILPIIAVATWARVSGMARDSILPDDQLRALRAVSLFAPLPLDAIERLARCMRPRRYGPGEVLMREGEPGGFYVVLTEGEVEVSRDSRAVAALGPGDGVGEIALLRQVPRTATVTATTTVESYILDGDEFRAAIVGPALVVADSLIDERMVPAAS